MQPAPQSRPHAAVGLASPAAEFTCYCEGEFERRRNAGDEFDEAGYQEAMELALARLRVLEDEGRA